MAFAATVGRLLIPYAPTGWCSKLFGPELGAEAASRQRCGVWSTLPALGSMLLRMHCPKFQMKDEQPKGQRRLPPGT